MSSCEPRSSSRPPASQAKTCPREGSASRHTGPRTQVARIGINAEPLSTSCKSPPPWNLLLPGASPPERRAALELRRAPLRAAPPTGEGRTLPQDPFPFDRLQPLSSTLHTSTPVSTESREGQLPARVGSGGRRAGVWRGGKAPPLHGCRHERTMPITTEECYRSYAELLAHGRRELGQVPCPAPT